MDAMRAAVLMLACASVVQRIYQSGSKSKEVVPLLRKSGRPSSQRLEDIETKPREKALERFKSGNSSTDVVFTGAQWWKVSADGHFTADKEESIVKITNRYFGENPNSRMQHFVVNDDTRSLAIRALTAQKWILDDAIALLDNMLEWRLENRVDDLLSEPLPVETLHHIRSCLFDGFYGVCNDGFPIYFCFGGRLDLAECTRLVGLEAIIKYHIQVMEYNHHVYYKKVSSMIGQTVSKVTLVLDLSGFGGHNVKSAFWNCCNAIGDIDDKCYFEWLHRVFIVNAGFFFKIFWKTASALLNEETKSKFKVLNSPQQLQQFIPSHELPEYFGGTAPDEGAFCTKEHPWTDHYQKFDSYCANQAASKNI